VGVVPFYCVRRFYDARFLELRFNRSCAVLPDFNIAYIFTKIRTSLCRCGGAEKVWAESNDRRLILIVVTGIYTIARLAAVIYNGSVQTIILIIGAVI